ncbi:MAG: sugar ABC transporter permease, partial [Actinomycetales bacterium]|nr:sugar ABC transporter permease [Actinomycetales bacterium]
ARLGGAAPTAGQLLELDAIAAAVIGGTSFAGGIGRIPGALLGALLLTGIDNVMSLMNVSSFLQMVIKGTILLAAVWFDLMVRNKRKK